MDCSRQITYGVSLAKLYAASHNVPQQLMHSVVCIYLTLCPQERRSAQVWLGQQWSFLSPRFEGWPEVVASPLLLPETTDTSETLQARPLPSDYNRRDAKIASSIAGWNLM